MNNMALNKVQIASRSRMNPSRSRMNIQGQDSKFSFRIFKFETLRYSLKRDLEQKNRLVKNISLLFGFFFFLKIRRHHGVDGSFGSDFIFFFGRGFDFWGVTKTFSSSSKSSSGSWSLYLRSVRKSKVSLWK